MSYVTAGHMLAESWDTGEENIITQIQIAVFSHFYITANKFVGIIPTYTYSESTNSDPRIMNMQFSCTYMYNVYMCMYLSMVLRNLSSSDRGARSSLKSS